MKNANNGITVNSTSEDTKWSLAYQERGFGLPQVWHIALALVLQTYELGMWRVIPYPASIMWRILRTTHTMQDTSSSVVQ